MADLTQLTADRASLVARIAAHRALAYSDLASSTTPASPASPAAEWARAQVHLEERMLVRVDFIIERVLANVPLTQAVRDADKSPVASMVR